MLSNLIWSVRTDLGFGRNNMWEFDIDFNGHGMYGDVYTVYSYDPELNYKYSTIMEKLFYGYTQKEIITKIKNEIYERFGIKKAKFTFYNNLTGKHRRC